MTEDEKHLEIDLKLGAAEFKASGSRAEVLQAYLAWIAALEKNGGFTMRLYIPTEEKVQVVS